MSVAGRKLLQHFRIELVELDSIELNLTELDGIELN